MNQSQGENSSPAPQLLAGIRSRRVRLGVAEVAIGVLAGAASGCLGLFGLFELLLATGDGEASILEPSVAIPMLVGGVLGLLGGVFLVSIGWRLVRRELD